MKRLPVVFLAALAMMSCDDTKSTQPNAQSTASGPAYLVPRLQTSAADGLPPVDSIHLHLTKLPSESTLLDTVIPASALDSFELSLPRALPFRLAVDGFKIRPSGTVARLWTGEIDDTARTDATPLVARIRLVLLPQDLAAPRIIALSQDTALDAADSTCTLNWIVTDDSLLSVTGNGLVLRDSAGMHSELFRLAPGSVALAAIHAFDRAGNTASDTIRITRPLPPATPKASSPTFALGGGSDPGSVAVEILDATAGTDIHFTANGMEPTCQDSLYTVPLVFETSTQLKAIACSPNTAPSLVDSIRIELTVATPAFSLAAGTYTQPQSLSMSTITPKAAIHYATDGKEPSCDGRPYTAPIAIDSGIRIKAIACREGWTSSAIGSAAYLLQIPDLSFSPDSGIYAAPPSVGITSSLAGTTILYTTDSTMPTYPASAGTNVYTSPIRLPKSGTLRAMAIRPGWIASPIATRSYIVYRDTIPLADFESGKPVTLWGAEIRPFGCASGMNTSGTHGCTLTKNSSQLPVPVRVGDPAELGTRVARMDFDLHATTIVGLEDPANGPGFAGIYARVPESAMAQANLLLFWARFEPSPGNSAVTAPMLLEFAHTGLDNDNPGMLDVFQRLVVPLDTTWRQYAVSLGMFWYPREAIVSIADSTRSTPKTPSWILTDSYGIGSSSAMNALGLCQKWGSLHHSDSDITWVHGVDRDAAFSKASIDLFRWSILQPSSQPLAQDVDPVAGLSASFRGALLLDKLQIVRAIP